MANEQVSGRKRTDLSNLQNLPPGEWGIVEFVTSVGYFEFSKWVKEFVSTGYKQELESLDGKTKLHIQGAKYDDGGNLLIGGYEIFDEKIVQAPDIIRFFYKVMDSEDKYGFSATSNPIAIDYFCSLLEAIANKWPESYQAIEEYLVRLERLANGAQNDLHMEAKKLKDDRKRAEPGRRHSQDDIWAWEQVNINKRPMNEVYSTWKSRGGVVKRKLQDPRRQFNRITKPTWGQKTKK